MSKIYFGTSGWSYEDWVGIFYERSEGKLRYYSKVFNSVEMDSTFYSYPSKDIMEGIAKALPSDFRICVKMPNVITHKYSLGKKGDISKYLDKFIDILRPLVKRGILGAVLIQLPPNFKYDYNLLKSFLEMLDHSFRYAIEFRDSSWLKDDIYDLLRKFNVAYTIVDEPLLPPITPTTTDFTYIRWHGRGERPWYNYLYSEEELKMWLPKIKNLMKRVQIIYGYFNNHFRAYAVQNCLQILSMLGLLDKKRQRLMMRVRENIKTPIKLLHGPIIKSKEIERKSMLELLLLICSKERVQRGLKIKNEDVKIMSINNIITAKVRNYDLVIDLDNKVLSHNCADWARVTTKKGLCKHYVKLFIMFPEEKAKSILKDIIINREKWRFSVI